MSRKRTFNIAELNSGAESSEEDYNYLSPGCYCTPQISFEKVQSCEEELLQGGDFCRPETYVLDQCGNVFLLNEMQQQQGDSEVLLIDNFPLLEFEGPSLAECVGFETEPAVSPRKKEKLEHEDEDDESNENVLPPNPNVYRAKEGYLVEEPPDETDNQSKKRSKNNCGDGCERT